MTTARGAGRLPRHGGPQSQSQTSAPGPTGPGAHQADGGEHRGTPRNGGHGPDGPGNPLSYAKALAIVVVAVALGVYLLSLGKGHGASATATRTTPPSTAPSSSTTTSAPTTTVPTAAPSKSVGVLVANASHTTGIATYYSGKLASAGWGTVTPENATTVTTTSTVYYAAGQQADANAVATELGLPTTDVQPLGSTVPVVNLAGADVVVIAGEDLAAKVPASTTTSAAG